MTEPEVIEGTALELYREPSHVVAQPGQALVSKTDPSMGMIATATALANALKGIVDGQKLYTEIRGKRYPQVEAWMTIGRMDNVVAREAERPIRNEDASYEAFVELVRLSDGMVIGRASALCGTKDDPPWNSRSEPARRSMAVTRATSRAFRQQYSWIMALAGYEPTPADEMPSEADGRPAPPHLPPRTDPATADPPPDAKTPYSETTDLIGRERRQGIIRKGTSNHYKLEPHIGPEGAVLGFKLDTGKGNIPQCVTTGALGDKLMLATSGKPESLVGQRATVAGKLLYVKGNRTSEGWYRLEVDTFETDEWVLTAERDPEPVLPEPPEEIALPFEAES